MKPMASVIFNIQKMYLSSKKSSQGNEVSSQTNKSESIMLDIQKVLIWDDPFFTCCCILFVNIVFWLIIYLDLKFYGIIFTTLLILTCEQLWMEHFSESFNNQSNSQNPMSDSSKTLYRRLFSSEANTLFKQVLTVFSSTYVKGRVLRQSQPGMFCALTCIGFLFIGLIGKSFSSLRAFYILLMAVMTIPGALIRFLPPDVINNGLSIFFYCIHRENDSDNDDEVEPYLLETNEEALELLRLAGDLHLSNKEDDVSNDLLLEHLSEHASDTAESISSRFSLYPDAAVMPSPENSMDFWESDVNFWEKTESSGNPNNEINFQSQHFDGDSSEEEFVKGLYLSEETVNKKKEFKPNNPALPTDKLISCENFVATQIISKNPTGTDRESSSDTDSFELISEEDM